MITGQTTIYQMQENGLNGFREIRSAIYHVLPGACLAIDVDFYKWGYRLALPRPALSDAVIIPLSPSLSAFEIMLLVASYA